MLQLVRKIFSSPQFIDPNKTRVARLVWAMSLIFFVGTLFVCALFVYQLPQDRLIALSITILVSCLTFITLWFLSQKRVRAASHLFTFNFFLGVLINAFLYGGIRSSSSAGYIIFLIIAGLLLGTRRLLYYLGLSIVSVTVLYYLESIGLIQNASMSQIQVIDLGMLIAAMGIAGLLLYAAIGSIESGYGLLNNALVKLQNTTVSKTYVDNIIASMQDMLFVITPDTRIEKINYAVLDLLGYKEEDLLGQPLQILLAPEYRLLWQPPTTMASPLFAMRDKEMQFLAKDGREICAAVSTAIMKEEDQTKPRIVCIANDITQRKQFELELKGAKVAAEEGAKAKTEFLASMSHEIRTPLNAVIGMTSLLLDTSLNSEQEDYVNTARTSGDGLLGIINNILDFSKIDSGKLELEQNPFILRDCVEEATDLLAAQAAEKNLYLNVFIEPDVPTSIQSDVTRLRQILVNLLSNAVKFTAAGEVNLWVGSQQQPEGTQISFMVRDTGIGVPKDRMDRLFEPFRQVDSSTTREFGGTGLGLAISKRLVNLMGGDIWAESAPNQGSTFYFTIQTQPVPSIKETAATSVNQPLHQLAGKQVLVCHQNQTSRVVLGQQLNHWQPMVTYASTAQELFNTLNDHPAFDLIVLDSSVVEGETLLQVKKVKEAAPTSLLFLLTPMGKPCTCSKQNLDVACLNWPYHLDQFYQQLNAILTKKGNGRLQPVSAPKSQFNSELGIEHPLRILLAEDNLINQKVALRMLQRLGYTADVASNGLEAVRALSRQPYDLILMDIQMPELDGIQATQRIRQEWLPHEQPRIVAMTANALVGDRETYLASGMDDYVSKPVKVAELTQVLHHCQPLIAQS